MRRNDIPGQEELKDVFTRLIDGDKLPHALLIHSQEGGVGMALAMFLTQYLLCDQRNGSDACGVCPNCSKMNGLTHPDVHFILPVNSTKEVKKDHANSDRFLEDWREAFHNNPFLSLRDWYQSVGIEKSQGFIGENEGKELRSKLALRSYEGRARVFILWHADRMHPVFGNKMLKNLEEPSERTHFILLSEEPSHLLPTILSRTQRFQEEVLSEDVLTQFLCDRVDLSDVQARNIVFRAEGNVHAAVMEAEQKEDPWLEAFRDWMRFAYKRDLVQLFKWSEKIAKNTRDSQRQFIDGSLKMLDRCFRMGWLEMHIPMEGEEASFFTNFSPFINSANVKQFMDLLEEASFHVERNVNGKIVWYDTSIKAIRLIHAGKKALTPS